MAISSSDSLNFNSTHIDDIEVKFFCDKNINFTYKYDNKYQQLNESIKNKNFTIKSIKSGFFIELSVEEKDEAKTKISF